MLIVCNALSLSHLRCQLSPGESLGLSVLFVWYVTVGFAGVGSYCREHIECSPTDDLFIVWVPVGFVDFDYCTREGRPLPYGRFDYFVNSRVVCTYTVGAAWGIL